MIDAKIVVDSSANMTFGCPGIASVPLKIITDKRNT